jgi:hypothetical protein
VDTMYHLICEDVEEGCIKINFVKSRKM